MYIYIYIYTSSVSLCITKFTQPFLFTEEIPRENRNCQLIRVIAFNLLARCREDVRDNFDEFPVFSSMHIVAVIVVARHFQHSNPISSLFSRNL